VKHLEAAQAFQPVRINMAGGDARRYDSVQI